MTTIPKDTVTNQYSSEFMDALAWHVYSDYQKQEKAEFEASPATPNHWEMSDARPY